MEELVLYLEGPARGVDLLLDDVKVVPDRYLLLRWPVSIALAIVGAGWIFGLATQRRRWSAGCGVAAIGLALGLLTSWIFDHRSAVVIGPAPDYAKKMQPLGFETVVRGETLEVKEDIYLPTLYQAAGVRIYGTCTTNPAIVSRIAEIHGRVLGKIYFRGHKITIMPNAEVAGGIDASGQIVRYGKVGGGTVTSGRPASSARAISLGGLVESLGGVRENDVLVDPRREAEFLQQIALPGNRVPWSPGQAAGAPDTRGAGDLRTAWASQNPDGGPEWLKLEYELAVPIAQVRVRETYNPGAVTAITARRENGSEVFLWQGEEPKGKAPLEREFTVTNAVVARTITVHLDTRRVAGWNEIDAVELVGRDGSRQWAKSATASSFFGQK